MLTEAVHAFVRADQLAAAPDSWLSCRRRCHIEPGEMARTFNCGIGMALIVSPEDETSVFNDLLASAEMVYRIGRLTAGQRGCTVGGPAGSWTTPRDWAATHHG